MYSETELAGAVKAGILDPATLDALRTHIAAQRGEASTADDEQVRLVTGFNDIFVTIACALVIFAAGSVGKSIALGSLLIAVASWAMAEMFTRKRRMALPSIVLLLAFVIGLGTFAGALVQGQFVPHDVVHSLGVQTYHDSAQGYTAGQDQITHYTTQELYPWQQALIGAAGALVAGLGAFAHWRRFHVPITVAALVAALVLLALSGVAAATVSQLESNAFIAPAALLCGLGVFAFAMRWDLSDPTRVTIKADIAFWLHLLAAPLIAHPLFYWMGVTNGNSITIATAVGVVALYLVFGAVALAVDRRALLVSALAYVLIALTQLFKAAGHVQESVALTALVIGSALLALSAFWGAIRKGLLLRLPDGLAGHLPHAAA
jgi:hypothetical protein